MRFDAKTEVGTTDLAEVLGITARRVYQLVQDGIIKPKSRGKYVLSAAVQAFIDSRVKDKSLSQADIEKQDAEARIKMAKAVVAELEAQELQGKMHRSEDVAAMTEDLIYAARGMLLALPGRLAVDAAALDDPAEVSVLLRSEVHAIMEEISNYRYDQRKYEERVRERLRWGAADYEGEGDDCF